jgi:hypothetical protein
MTTAAERRQRIRDGIRAQRIEVIAELLSDKLTPADRRRAAAVLSHVVTARLIGPPPEDGPDPIDLLIAEAIADGRLVEFAKACIAVGIDAADAVAEIDHGSSFSSCGAISYLRRRAAVAARFELEGEK